MTTLFRLSHLDGAPLLKPVSSGEIAWPLGESIALLDAEPVIVVDVDHVGFTETIAACMEILLAKRQDAAIIVIDTAHTIRVPSSHDGPTGVKVVDSVTAAAVSAQRLQRHKRGEAEHEAAHRHRFRVRSSIA